MRNPDIKNNWSATLILLWSLGIQPVGASVDIPLTWKSVHIRTDDRGGAELNAAIGTSGELDRLELTIRGRQIAIPPKCLQGLVRPYLNGISIAYGQFDSGQSSWSLEIPFDGSGSVEFGATFNLVFSDTELVWSYQSIQIDDRTWEDRDVCPYSPSGRLEPD
jgi:hypothetical protein